MSPIHVRSSVPNCLIAICGSDEAEPPEFEMALVCATHSMILVMCIPWIEGPVEVILGDDADVAPGEVPVHDGLLATPLRVVRLVTIDRKVLAEQPVPNQTMRVRIWTNHPVTPDKIIIGLS